MLRFSVLCSIVGFATCPLFLIPIFVGASVRFDPFDEVGICVVYLYALCRYIEIYDVGEVDSEGHQLYFLFIACNIIDSCLGVRHIVLGIEELHIGFVGGRIIH